MGKTLKEKLLDLKKDVEITTVAVMNNGETFEDSYGFLKRMTDKCNLEKPEVIEEYIYKAAETYSARAGYSEHQLGLAVDILNHSHEFIDEDNVEYNWLVDNSYKYGFILRYPRGKEYITGYVFEDWHFRYLGIELAKKVRQSNLTYDEYVARGL